MTDIIKKANEYTAHKLPVPAKSLAHLMVLLNDDDPQISLVADVISIDLSLTLAILSYVNGIKKKANKPSVDNIESAIKLTGLNQIKNIVSKIPILEKTFTDSKIQHGYAELQQVIQHSALQAVSWAELRKDKFPAEVYTASMLHMVTYCYICLYDFSTYMEIYERYASTNENVNASATHVLGVNYSTLAIEMSDQLGLPELVSDSLNPRMHQFYRPMGIMIASELAIQAKSGWYHKGILHTQELVSEYLAINLDTTIKNTQLKAIELCRTNTFGNCVPVASSLICPVPGKKKVVKEVIKVSYIQLAAKINNYVNKNIDKPIEALRLVINEIYKTLKLKRVVLAVPSKKTGKLKFNIVLGDKGNSPFSQYEVDMFKKSIFSLLLKHSHSEHLKGDVYIKYEPLIPSNFKAIAETKEFLVMSLFNGKKPLAVIWADNKGDGIAKDQYVAFKLVINNLAKKLID